MFTHLFWGKPKVDEVKHHKDMFFTKTEAEKQFNLAKELITKMITLSHSIVPTLHFSDDEYKRVVDKIEHYVSEWHTILYHHFLERRVEDIAISIHDAHSGWHGLADLQSFYDKVCHESLHWSHEQKAYTEFKKAHRDTIKASKQTRHIYTELTEWWHHSCSEMWALSDALEHRITGLKHHPEPRLIYAED